MIALLPRVLNVDTLSDSSNNRDPGLFMELNNAIVDIYPPSVDTVDTFNNGDPDQNFNVRS
jgi:hypothetical protein